MVYQDNLLVTLNSKNASLNNGTLKSNVSFNFISLLRDEELMIRTYVSVLNAQIPVSFYVINSTNNKLIYNTFAPNTQITLTIPPGNYNSFVLSTTLTSLFLTNGITIIISINSQTGIMIFQQALNAFTIYVSSSIASVLGMYNSNLSGLTITFPYPVNLLGVKKINIKSNALAINSASSETYTFSSNIVSIPVNEPYFSMISYVNTNNLNMNILKALTVDDIDIQMTDENDKLLDFNNLDWTITLCLASEKKDIVRDRTTLKDIVSYKTFINNSLENLPVQKVLTKDQEELKLLEK